MTPWRQQFLRARLILQGIIYFAVVILFLLFFIQAFMPYPLSAEANKNLTYSQLIALRHSLRNENGAERMQAVFPEGACFTYTLYGLAWTNLARQFPADHQLNLEAQTEAHWALDQLPREPARTPFVDTQVRLGVFWLGQRNLLLGRLLSIQPETQRVPELVAEFNDNSAQLAAAFLASPTHHLDSYPDMCWPADNVTALASLIVHDSLYQTNYRVAYEAWKKWTTSHADPSTGMPAGHLHQQSGQLIEPARGCANSWNLALLAEIDPPFARQQYQLYRDNFAIRRVGFLMFREYPKGNMTKADIDSGPIILGAGITATGVGLAATRANGDAEMAGDIYKLSRLFGIPLSAKFDGKKGRDHLFGLAPVGDAFLAYGNSVPQPSAPLYNKPGMLRTVRNRISFLIMSLVAAALLAVRGYFFIRKIKRTFNSPGSACTV